VAQDACERLAAADGGGRRRSAVISPVRHGIDLGRLGFMRKRHQDVAQVTGITSRVVRPAETQ
jgi:hypothetical protein